MQYQPSTESERAGFRHFENLYARWSAAAGALVAAELHLWSETLRDPDGQSLRPLAQEVLRLRGLADSACRALPGADDAVRSPHAH